MGTLLISKVREERWNPKPIQIINEGKAEEKRGWRSLISGLLPILIPGSMAELRTGPDTANDMLISESEATIWRCAFYTIGPTSNHVVSAVVVYHMDMPCVQP